MLAMPSSAILSCAPVSFWNFCSAAAVGSKPNTPSNAVVAATSCFFVVLLETEINPVMAKLIENGIEVTVVHSHMLNEQPRLFFMHFWANDDAVKLAKGLRAALDKTASAKS